MNKHRLASVKSNYGEWSERHPYAATTAETIVVSGIKLGIKTLGKRALGVNLWNANPNINKSSEEISTKYKLWAMSGAPLNEEIIYRALPHNIGNIIEKRGHKKTADNIKQTADAVFALGHSGLIARDEEGKLTPNLKITKEDHAIPVTPYIGAKYYRFLAEKRGMKHAIFAHVLNNTLAAVARSVQVHAKKK